MTRIGGKSFDRCELGCSVGTFRQSATTCPSPLPGTAAPPRHVPFPAPACSSSAQPRCRSSRSPTTKEIDEANRALLVASLKHSGFDVDDVSIQAGGETATAAIQSAALERKADLLVAGGFGHSRLRELILGGVTRELLVKAELPVLLAH
nr:universal stress protein [Rhizobium leguminosarum]